jgi:hypothetical protein
VSELERRLAALHPVVRKAIEEHVARVIAEAPRPTQESVDRIAALFREFDSENRRQEGAA